MYPMPKISYDVMKQETNWHWLSKQATRIIEVYTLFTFFNRSSIELRARDLSTLDR